MAEIILVTSGKGGVGKSTILAHTSRALAARGKKVLLVELSSRALDVLFGKSDEVLYDITDLENGICNFQEVVRTTDLEGIHLICGPAQAPSDFSEVFLGQLVETADPLYDFIFLEADGTDPQKLKPLALCCDRAVVVSTADPVSARACRADTDLLAAQGVLDLRLFINMLPRDFAKVRPIPDLDWLIDNVCAQLIAVLPMDNSLSKMSEIGKGIGLSNLAKLIFDNFAQRILGNYIDLLVQ